MRCAGDKTRKGRKKKIKKNPHRMQEEGGGGRRTARREKGRKGVDGIVFISDVECDDDFSSPSLCSL